ncbi:hypothetical protein GQ55_7G180400 [Panicum hallii var. hallii]|uniref:NAC domain-containing protein n=1 Tax=Panicum hallii var. hallii TaxID=1504633 RepID=A0A2T7CW99_9POAL|nr:hypothetical protein GQ55_7G180400 [Panicum hallii var. hallii]
MAQPPEATTAPVPALDVFQPWSISEMPRGYVFQPKARCLLDYYLVPMALHGRVAERNIRDSVAQGVDVYAVRPEALPSLRCNRDRFGQVWGYFFATRPAAAGGSSAGSSHGDDVREVAAGGCWRRYGGEVEYVGEDGEAYAFRRRFAFHEAGDGGNKTVWRMKESASTWPRAPSTASRSTPGPRAWRSGRSTTSRSPTPRTSRRWTTTIATTRMERS